MNIELSLFYFFSFLSIVFSIFVVISNNPIHSILSLVLVFFNTVGLLILLGAEFLSMLFLIVYVGAVAVLFLFVIMMLNIKVSAIKSTMFRYIPIGVLLSFIFFNELSTVLNSDLTSLNWDFLNSSFPVYINFSICQIDIWVNCVFSLNNIFILGNILYTYYSFLFIVSGIILLVSMLGAISLTLHRRNDVRRQYIYKQVQRNFSLAILWKN